MELRAGYKRTEIGILPVDWCTERVADLVEPTAPICYGVVQVGQHTENGIPIVAIKFVKEISHAPLHRTAASLEKPYSRSRSIGGDVLISIKGTIGRVGIVPNGFQGNISRELARLRIRRGACSEYFAHQLEASTTQERIMRAVVGTTRLEFSIAALRQFELPTPPTIDEQRAIAAALSDIDALLSGLDRLIAKKRALKQAAMQQLLTGKTRLPGFEGEWEVRRLGELSEVRGGLAKNVSVAIQDPVSLAYLRVANVQDGHVELSDVSFISIPRQDLRRYSLRAGDVLMNEGGDLDQLGRGAVWRGQIDPCIHQNHVFAVRCGDSLLPDYLNAWTSGVQSRQYFMLAGKQTTNLASISKSSLGELPVALPSVAEQQAIAAVLADMDAELEALEARREKTQVLKQGMMQELLTGRTRLV